MWQFCSKGHLLRIEKVQLRALKFVYYNDFGMSYSLALSQSNMQHLYVQRQRYMSTEVFNDHEQGPLHMDVMIEGLYSLHVTLRHTE